MRGGDSAAINSGGAAGLKAMPVQVQPQPQKAMKAMKTKTVPAVKPTTKSKKAVKAMKTKTVPAVKPTTKSMKTMKAAMKASTARKR